MIHVSSWHKSELGWHSLGVADCEHSITGVWTTDSLNQKRVQIHGVCIALETILSSVKHVWKKAIHCACNAIVLRVEN
ncbi:hypothetical protein PHET_01498 [Paragonimus heterotremus]|uniref:Uncharacterized protein n=1 Tax=Paragonimus heterotremus TaxID=100268 RepID=A0A8J4STV0_9TREM|nr:hypothetical protein PHET_01498 [Paragonimus heterotremus]